VIAIAPLLQLQQSYPNADIFLSGELAIDFPEDVKIPIEPNQMVTASVVGNNIRFSYCGLEKAIALLKEQLAVGTVEVRIVQLQPKYDI
jgi:inner membrane protein